MKYKEEKLKFYGLLGFFIALGWVITTQVKSLNSLGYWPILQIFTLILISVFGVRLFVGNKTNNLVICFLLTWFFTCATDLMNMLPLLGFALYVLIYSLLGSPAFLSAPVSIMTFFDLKPLYFILLMLPFYKNISLLINSLLVKKESFVEPDNDKEFLANLPKASDSSVEYGGVTIGSVQYVSATQTIVFKAKEATTLIPNLFVFKDKKNSILFFNKSKRIVTSEDISLSEDKKVLFISKVIKPSFIGSVFKKEKPYTATYCFPLENVDEMILEKIYEFLRIEYVGEEEKSLEATPKLETLKTPAISEEYLEQIQSSKTDIKEIDSGSTSQ